MIERHTIKELCELLKMSLERTRQLIKDEPGVLRFSPTITKGKTPIRTMYRVPESVIERILRRSANR